MGEREGKNAENRKTTTTKTERRQRRNWNGRDAREQARLRERKEREREKREKGQGGEIGEKTTYINDMMDGGRGLSTIPNRHRNAQELQGDCPGSWGQGGRRRGARGARI